MEWWVILLIVLGGSVAFLYIVYALFLIGVAIAAIVMARREIKEERKADKRYRDRIASHDPSHPARLRDL